MTFEVLLATNNQGKVVRYRKLAKEIDENIVLHTLNDLNVNTKEIEENGTLEENSKKKAEVYLGEVSVPIIANDSGFYVEGMGLIKNPKRVALKTDESNLTKEEIYSEVLNYWRNVAKSYGGEVDAAWVDVFSIVLPDGRFYTAEARREIILTDKVFGEPHIQFPVRALYISKKTNKPAILHTDEEELIEISPIKEALENLFNKLS